MEHAPKRTKRRIVALSLAIIPALMLAALIDMAWGAQLLGPLLGPKKVGADFTEYYDGGLQIGNWRITNGPIHTEDVGTGILVLEDGTHFPVVFIRMYHRDGTIARDVVCYDEDGNEAELYPLDTSPQAGERLPPIPLIVEREFDDRGNPTGENRIVNGRPTGK